MNTRSVPGLAFSGSAFDSLVVPVRYRNSLEYSKILEDELDTIGVAACALSHVLSSKEGRECIVVEGVKSVCLSKLYMEKGDGRKANVLVKYLPWPASQTSGS